MKILLVGLGRANLGVARYLMTREHEVAVFEERPQLLAPEARSLINDPRLHPYQPDRYDLAVTSPGFAPDKPIIRELTAAGTPVVDEIEFTYRELGGPRVVAVTGTNGKSTTIALVHNILVRAGIDAFLGGNLAPGRPFSDALMDHPRAWYCLEVSSFQLSRIVTFRPRVAVVTNLQMDHLNWHGTFEHYARSKARIFENQTGQDHAVINMEDERVCQLIASARSQVVWFGPRARNGAWFDGRFHYRRETLFGTERLHLLGGHNLLNVMAAIAVGKVLAVPDPAIESGVSEFKPLPHRLEDLGSQNGIRYINNSMSTNEAAAIASLQAITGPKVVILGGYGKGDKCHGYLDHLMTEAKACILLGDNAADIADYFRAHGYDRFGLAHTMDEAIAMSRGYAGPGDTIMLNPGFASFGLFRDFQERGEAFRNGIR